MQRANDDNMRDPTTGYDVSFGRPAIRTYRAFIFYNKAVRGDDKASWTVNNGSLLAAADRCAQQIDFLRRRHLAQSEAWVRNHDTQNNNDILRALITPLTRSLQPCHSRAKSTRKVRMNGKGTPFPTTSSSELAISRSAEEALPQTRNIKDEHSTQRTVRYPLSAPKAWILGGSQIDPKPQREGRRRAQIYMSAPHQDLFSRVKDWAANWTIDSNIIPVKWGEGERGEANDSFTATIYADKQVNRSRKTKGMKRSRAIALWRLSSDRDEDILFLLPRISWIWRGVLENAMKISARFLLLLAHLTCWLEKVVKFRGK